MSRGGSCPCGAVRFTVVGPLRDVIVCHCADCRAANGGVPWAASAAQRGDLELEAPDAVAWQQAPVSSYGASRGLCRACGAYVLWDAPGRTTISVGAGLLDGGRDLPVAAHIWVAPEERDALRERGIPAHAEGMPDGITVAWQGETPSTG